MADKGTAVKQKRDHLFTIGVGVLGAYALIFPAMGVYIMAVHGWDAVPFGLVLIFVLGGVCVTGVVVGFAFREPSDGR